MVALLEGRDAVLLNLMYSFDEVRYAHLLALYETWKEQYAKDRTNMTHITSNELMQDAMRRLEGAGFIRQPKIKATRVLDHDAVADFLAKIRRLSFWNRVGYDINMIEYTPDRGGVRLYYEIPGSTIA